MPSPPRNSLQKLALPALLLLGAFAVKWWYRTATVDELGFVLGPVSTLVSALSGEGFVFIPGSGYFFSDLSVLIDRSCSGVNFMIITAATFAFLIMRRSGAGCISPLIALVATAGSYGLTVLANSGRILSMIKFQQMGIHLGPTMHEALGALFFLIALLIATLLLDHFIERTHRPHAQYT